ncbi:hypothetical protein ACFU8X_10235 [Brevibacillus porteri]|uniref:hypothetical protein n=1 Tax=Brevibacillus TaxID=55080 RepID=UPI000B1AFFD8|nr:MULTISPECIES: hypothetical protein [Brevibacillus]MED1919039.1 hypothetical protein [Bacillus thuringiensis]MBY0084764.1 hypothetical protein [Brevibacillus brevis]MCC8435688.1 hypothetical protein [Brevibacillus sp. M2.1A]MCE0448894.1 hypothetical protein [Brevibacillus sp. AF8]MCM3142077.1 hypothetical protein [Brevibacillus sp. MER 51]
MMDSTDQTLDQKTLIEIMLQVYEKGQQTTTMGTRDIVEDIVNRVRPYFKEAK